MKRARTDSSDEPSKNDKHFASAFWDLESEVCDLDRMSEIADLLVMEWMESSGSPPLRQAELAVCAVQQLHRLLNEFKTKYYRAFEGDNEVAG
jgi:hypothetical protein